MADQAATAEDESSFTQFLGVVFRMEAASFFRDSIDTLNSEHFATMA